MLASLSLLSPLNAVMVVAFALTLLVGFAVLRWLAGPPAAVARRWALVGLRAAVCITLVVILLNPSAVTQSPGQVDRPDMFYLLDASQSMAVGDKETRFEHAKRIMSEAQTLAGDESGADIRLFRFGHRLAAVLDSGAVGLSTSVSAGAKTAGKEVSETSERDSNPAQKPGRPLAPTDADTQLVTALRQASSRFGRRPPAGLVLFSDGRVRDDAGVEQVARQFAELDIPIHVVPVGDTSKGGDVAIVAVVVPPRVRRFSEVEVQVFLRSYGFEGRRCEVALSSLGRSTEEASETALVAPIPVTLHDGFQSVGLTFRTDSQTRKLRVQVSSLPNEVSAANNEFSTEVAIDRTKIRVLYVEGSSQPLQTVMRGTRYEVRGPFTDLQQSLIEDEDIECVVLAAPYGQGRLQRVMESGVSAGRGFPETIAELAAFDAIILSDVARESFTDQQLEWIDKWIGQRGGGLLMVGGQRSFGAGGWEDSPLAAMLPVEMRADNDWIPGTQVSVQANLQALQHPLWAIVNNDVQNREIIGRFPSFFGANLWAGVKPNLTRVLANSNLSAADAPSLPVVNQVVVERPPTFFETLRRNLIGEGTKVGDVVTEPGGNGSTAPNTPKLDPNAANQPAIVAGQYGRGRTMAMSVPITSPWASDFLTKWSSGDARHYGKFWRNAVYWLTESSSIGRRRLIVSADKKFYRPGETIRLSATAFDEAANQTGSYKIMSMIEPQMSLNDLESNYSPVRWPDGKPRESGESGPFVAWGEEFDLPRVDSANGKPAFALELPIADALAVGSASQSLRIELTAMEDFTQVDSTSLDVQILHDPFEQQNPFPNHDLLASVARSSGGKVIASSEQLADVLRDVPTSVGPPVVKKTPLWSTWWLWFWVLGLLTVEWLWRRVVGLA